MMLGSESYRPAPGSGAHKPIAADCRGLRDTAAVPQAYRHIYYDQHPWQRTKFHEQR